jgi:CheY-like chemotaxis protein
LEQSAKRGSNIVKQVLTFARGLEGDRVLIQPRHLIKEIGSISNETFPKSIILQTDAPKDLWTVWGDPTQLHQVLLNLCVNARDAMPNGGTLTITANNTTLDAHYAKLNVDAKSGHYITISVADTGTGIQPELLEKIFEPFFTTKEPGKGTGLGLSTVYTIVKSHNGFVRTQSDVGKGATFTVYLPAQKAGRSADPTPQQAAETNGRGETILVVDDEAAVRDISKLTLESHGYTVLLASDGTEAIALYTRNKHRIAAVVLDIMMPYMDGVRTIRALRKINPDVKIIVASGHDQSNVLGERNGLTVDAFLLKPYTAERFLKTLSSVLEASSAS